MFGRLASRLVHSTNACRLLSTTPARFERGLNQIHLIGRVGRDPQVMESVKSGSTVTVFNLATSTKVNKETNAQMTEWHRVVSGGAMATWINSNITKGDRVYVQGTLVYRKVDVGEGIVVHLPSIFPDEVLLMSKKRQSPTEDDMHDLDEPEKL